MKTGAIKLQFQSLPHTKLSHVSKRLGNAAWVVWTIFVILLWCICLCFEAWKLQFSFTFIIMKRTVRIFFRNASFFLVPQTWVFDMRMSKWYEVPYSHSKCKKFDCRILVKLLLLVVLLQLCFQNAFLQNPLKNSVSNKPPQNCHHSIVTMAHNCNTTQTTAAYSQLI